MYNYSAKIGNLVLLYFDNMKKLKNTTLSEPFQNPLEKSQ